MRLSRWSICNNKKSIFVSQGSGLFDSLGLNTPQNRIKMTVCFYHVTYAFQSESTLYSCLNVKELLARSRREI